jgi:hypothetical protein
MFHFSVSAITQPDSAMMLPCCPFINDIELVGTYKLFKKEAAGMELP